MGRQRLRQLTIRLTLASSRHEGAKVASGVENEQRFSSVGRSHANRNLVSLLVDRVFRARFGGSQDERPFK
jgi:hypothetical protein